VLKNNVHVELELKKEQETGKKLKIEIDKLITEHQSCAAIQSKLLKDNKTLTTEKDKALAAVQAAKSENRSLKDRTFALVIARFGSHCLTRRSVLSRLFVSLNVECSTWAVEMSNRLVYRSFASMDSALFIRNPNGFYEAVKTEPNHFLSLSNRNAYESLGPRVVGKIILVENKEVAGSVRLPSLLFSTAYEIVQCMTCVIRLCEQKGSQNPYELPEGTVYYRVLADDFIALNSDKPSKSPTAAAPSNPDSKKDSK
jgi:hypothetical protein